MSKIKVLITGSAGMLGTDLCGELHNDYEVYEIDNRSRAGLNLPYNSASAPQRYFECDITDADATAAAITEIKPDIVIHAAAYTDVDGCEQNREKAYKINYEGTHNIALACKKSDSVLIYISTDFIFDGKKKLAYTEEDAPNPLSIYGQSKLKGEEAVKIELNNYFILRTSWLYGKNGKNFVDTIMVKAKSEKVLKVVDDQIGSPTYTKDLAKAINILISKTCVQCTVYSVQGTGIYNISNSGSVSWYGYAKEILKIAGIDTKVEPISSEELNRPAKRPAMSILDNSKFINFTGYKMRGWKEALDEYITDRKVKEKIC